MSNAFPPDLTLFLDILLKLEALDIPYVIIGGFAATMYGITRVTYDIDMIVDMDEEHIQALSDAYPLPRYYADPHQMRRAIEQGSSFNIIDVERGEKADLIPLSMDRRNEPAFEHRIRRTVDIVGREPFSVWVARPEDVMVGKLMAWQEGRSERHTADIFEMLLFHYLSVGEAGGRLMKHLSVDVPDTWGRKWLRCGSNSESRQKTKQRGTNKLTDPDSFSHQHTRHFEIIGKQLGVAMLYLWPQASNMRGRHRRFGVITTAAHRFVPAGIKEGRLWAFDNECFQCPFDYDHWLTHRHRLFPYSKRCLFVVVPDKPFDVHETLALWCRWHYKLRQQLDLSRLLNISSESQRHFPAGPLSPWPLWQ